MTTPRRSWLAPQMTPHMQRRVTLLVAAIVVVAFGWYVFGPSGADKRTLKAHFSSADSLFAGAPVKVLGVPIGTVTALHSRGSYVEVDISYDANRPLPADVGAVLVQPSVVGDRFVQLVPAYTTGPKLADHATLGVDRTQVPITLDQTYAALDKLAAALGPNGANKHGAVSDVLNVAADNLKGNGAATHAALTEVAAALKTLSNSRGDITGTVDNLVKLTTALAADDPEVRQLATNLATVSKQLDAQRGDLNGAINTLGPALTQVAQFVKSNRAALTQGVTSLTTVTGAIAKEKGALADILTVVPLAVTNLEKTYDAQNWDPADHSVPIDNRSGALQTRGNFFSDLSTQLGGTLSGVCATLNASAQGTLSPLCTLLNSAGTGLGGILTQLLGGVLGGTSLIPSAKTNSLAGLLIGGLR